MNYYNEIKNELINNEINRKVKNYSINKSDLNTYYNVGKLLNEAGKHYGNNIIGYYATKLKNDLNKKYNERTLRRYRQFYNFATNLKWSAMPTKLSWSHITELMVLSDEDEINYYINIVNNRNISYRKLSKLIKDNEYNRIDDTTKLKLLQKLILEDISSFLDELGEGFTFIKNEYPIKIGNRYNYIDLLLYNIKYKCYVVVELKVTELKKEHTGQIMTYMNYIDNNIKTVEENNTVGIIICREDNEYVIKYCSDNRIISREYLIV